MTLQRALLRWYDKNRRRLPWREKPTPYRVWISEIMLQQTQVSTVLPYYDRFLRRFPTLRALARAPERTVLKAWAGLGYYSRARNLRRAARELLERHGGRFPEDFDSVLALPGIGRYTAGAILSIAFGKPYPVVDGNVARVFSRLFGLKRNVKSPSAQKELWERARMLLDAKRPGDWNQALMELGALICLPESPRCGDCPLLRRCAARADGLEDVLPNMGPRKAPVRLSWKSLWIEQDGKVLLWRRSAKERFLPGHWGLPEARQLAGAARVGPRIKTVRHSITHHRIALELRRGLLRGLAPSPAAWAPKARLKDYLISSLWRKALPEDSNVKKYPLVVHPGHAVDDRPQR